MSDNTLSIGRTAVEIFNQLKGDPDLKRYAEEELFSAAATGAYFVEADKILIDADRNRQVSNSLSLSAPLRGSSGIVYARSALAALNEPP